MEVADPIVLVLGPLRVNCAGRAVALPAHKHRQLLAALVAGSGTPRSAEQLVDALWGDAAPASAGKLLQVYVSKLRKALPEEVNIRTTTAGYLVELADPGSDAEAFERDVNRASDAASMGDHRSAAVHLRRGLDRWRGAPFEDVPEDEIARAEAGRLVSLRRAAMSSLYEVELAAGRHREVIPELLALAAEEPFDEQVQGLTMQALYRAGRQSEALDVYRLTRTRLIDELGVEPGVELRGLHRRMLEQDAALDAPARPTLGARPLPAAPNPLRGRDSNVEEVVVLLRSPDVRLVVLTGAGGSGKTRLALEAARAVEADFESGVAFVDLTVIRDPAHLLRTISGALGVHYEPDSVVAVAQALRDRHLLLLVDNMEHLRSAGPDLVTLLSLTARLQLLVTSRVVLHLSGEHVYPVDPLSRHDAAALFVERARAADAHFSAAPDELVEALCDRLDDLPLAIELAAAQVRSATVSELLGRLRTRLPVLTGSPRDLPARQQTLDATVAWSADQLSDAERRALLRLSVFAGGTTAEAAQAVCGIEHEALASLVDHHLLVRQVTQQRSRYTLLETVREFALRHLPNAELDVLARAHARHYTGVAESLGLSVDALGSDLRARYDVARTEQANFRAALDWALGTDPNLGLQLALSLEQFWITSAPREGAARIGALLERAEDLPQDLHARALRDLGGSLEICGDEDEAMAVYARSLALFERSGDERSALEVRHRLRHGEFSAGRFDQVRQGTQADLVLARGRGYQYEEALLLGSLAFLELSQGELDSAFALYLESLELFRAMGGWPWGEAVQLCNLADTAAQMGDAERGERFGLAALSVGRDIGDAISVVFALATLAAVARVRPDEQRAGWLWGVVEAAERRAFLGRWHQFRDELAERVLAGRSEVFERARADGQRVHLDDAVQVLLDVEAT